MEKVDRPSDLAFKCYDKCMQEKKTHEKIGEELGISQVHVSRLIKKVKKWLEPTEKVENEGGVSVSYIQTPFKTTPNLTIQ